MAGRLGVICGPMFAGKSTELLRRVRATEDRGGAAVVIKPSWDKRYESTAPEVVTHDGARRAALAAMDAEEVRRVVASAAQEALIAIDEAHFFGAALVPVVLPLLEARRQLIVCGVELDHRGEPFEPFPTLLAKADEVIKLASRCERCGEPARHSQRMNESGDRIVVGGADLYEARCRDCFVPGS